MKIEIKVPNNKYQLLSIVLATALLVVAGMYLGTVTGKFTSVTQTNPNRIAQKTIDFINQNLLNGQTAKLVKVEDTPYGLYKIELEINGRTYTSYVTKDGKILFPSGIEMVARENTQTQTQTPEIPKRDVPDVKLFVMSYCPFGLQAEKALLPVMKLLGNKANITIHFVYYVMHGKKELDENLRQYCIEKTQKDKYYDYLYCFVQSGDYEKCLNKAGIDRELLKSCIEQTDAQYHIYENYNDQSKWYSERFPRWDPELELNQKYGVRGSPTIVINDRVVLLQRSPEAFKEAICSAFTNPPDECNQKLSTQTASPGIGPLTASGSDSEGSCG